MKLKSEIRNPKSETSFKYFNFENFKFVSNFVLLASCLLVLVAPLTVFAQGFVPLAPIPNLTTGVVADQPGLANFFNNLYKYLIGLAAILAIIEIIWGGLEYSTQDSVSKKSSGKNRIVQAILGLLLVLAPVLVFTVINPSILNLSIGLTPLDIPSSASPGGGGTPPPPTVDPASGCTVSGASGILQIATCPSDVATKKWGDGCSGNLSSTPITKNADGSAASSIVVCAGKQSYVFIDLRPTFSDIPAITGLQPLSTATGNSNNAASALQFANICQSANLGWKTCISDNPLVTFAVPCPPLTTQIPISATGKCYKETLSCSDASFASSNKCSGSPNWTPFQSGQAPPEQGDCTDSAINSCGTDNACTCSVGTRQCVTNNKPKTDPNYVERFVCK